MTDQATTIDLIRFYRLLDEDVPLNKIVKAMRLSWKEARPLADQYRADQRRGEREAERQERSRNRIEWMVSRARRSNLPIVLDLHTREFMPKVLRGETYKGTPDQVAHCLPDGLPDPDYIRARCGTAG